MKAAIIGLPQSGKSTVFLAATGQKIDPFAAPQAHTAVVKVPDTRLDYLAALCNPKKYTPATIELVDFPGCSLEDAKGREEWRRMLPAVRLADLLVVVVRDFEHASLPPYRNRIDAQADFDEIWSEMVFSDLEAVANRSDKLEKALKKPTATHEQEKHELSVLIRCREALEAERPLSSALQTDHDRQVLASFAFLTEKPIVTVRNVSDDKAGTAQPLAAAHAVDNIVLSASIEAEVAQLDPDDRAVFLAELGIAEPARDRLIRSCYRALGLISFLTMGPEEVRAWTIRKGSTAQEAAGKIHSDLARGFIRAETVAYDDLVAHTDMKGVKAAGKLRKEGKSYIVQDGDVMLILANA